MALFFIFTCVTPVRAEEPVIPDEKPDIILEDAKYAVYRDCDDSYELYKAFADKDSVNHIILPSVFEAETADIYYVNDISSVTISGETYYVEEESATDTDATDTDADEDVIIDNVKHLITAKLILDEEIAFDYTDGSRESLVISKSSLPSVSINLKVPLSTVHKNKEVKYSGTSVRVESLGSKGDEPDNLEVDNAVIFADDAEFKGRGNSTWKLFDKKGYQIKFAKKTSVLGMDKAKKWVLLADSSDPLMMKNKLVYDLAEEYGYEFSQHSEYVDLWVNGEYRGLYIICEKIELGTGRVELSDEHAIIVEKDNYYYYKEDYYFKDSYDKYYVLKDYESETPQEDLSAFENKLNLAEKYLDEKADWNKITSCLDVESFAKSYLFEEYFQNHESTVSSYFMYMNGPDDVIHAGPLWDFDSSMNFNNNCEVNDYYFRQDRMFALLMWNYPQFVALLKKYYENGLRESFSTASDRLYVYRSQIMDSVNYNTLRWNNLGNTVFKGGKFLAPYDANVYCLESWLDVRNRMFSIDELIKPDFSKKKSYVYEDRDYYLVFDPIYYADSYPDLKKKYGYDTQKLLRHFVLTGMNEKRNAAPGFDILVYINNYEDLRNKYGIDFKQYYLHYMDQGFKEGRTGKHDLIGYIVDEYIINYKADPIDIDEDDEPEKPVIEKVTMYRLYNPNSGEHFYTASTVERSNLISVGWRDEGVAWIAPKKTDKPVYRLYNPNAGDHHYTLSAAEKDNLVSVGWNYEGIGWYSSDKTGKPIYRVYNPNAIAGAHHFTLSQNEVKDLVKVGWKDEGIGWYSVP